MAKPDITAARLREAFSYNPDTGEFIRLIRDRYFTGTKAGNLSIGTGYWVLSVDDRQYLQHRLAWLYVHGEWPKNQIDHINGVRADNRLCNLRDVSNAENNQNKTRAYRTPKSSGLLGVCCIAGRWKAQITVYGKSRHIGYFDTPEQAHNAYIMEKRKVHSTCTL